MTDEDMFRWTVRSLTLGCRWKKETQFKERISFTVSVFIGLKGQIAGYIIFFIII